MLQVSLFECVQFVPSTVRAFRIALSRFRVFGHHFRLVGPLIASVPISPLKKSVRADGASCGYRHPESSPRSANVH